MIISETTRRWVEIRFYYLCLDIYNSRHDMRDVILAIEALSQLGNIDTKIIKQISGRLLSDPYFMPEINELMYLAHLNGIKTTDIAEYTNKEKSNVCHQIKRIAERFTAHPILSVDEDLLIQDFMKLVDILKKAGL